MARTFGLALGVLLVTGYAGRCATAADPPPEQGAASDKASAPDPADAIRAELAQVGELFREKKVAEAAAAVARARQAMDGLRKAHAGDALPADLATLEQRLVAAERLVARAVEPAPKSDTKQTSAKPTPPAKSKKPVPARPAAKIKPAKKQGTPPPSFTKDVAPILLARCGTCHVDRARGKLSMASYAALAKGNEGGPVVRPGASQASRLIEAIASGEMPRDGGQVPAEELAALARWIDSGAKFDGADPAAPLRAAAATPEAADRMATPLVKSTGEESVLFVRDLAPAIVTNCLSCHTGDRPTGGLRLTTFGDLLRGGTSGPSVVPGKADDSILVKKLRGTLGARMPRDKPPLADDLIARFETWIAEGAKFDGRDPAQPLPQAIELLAASRMSHEELAAQRVAKALKTWSLAIPDDRPAQIETRNFTLLGNVSPAQLTDIGAAAEAAHARIVKLLKLSTEEPVVKGRMVLFVFKRHFDYAEFGRMVEAREIPRGATGHSRSGGADAHACLVLSETPPEALAAAVAEQVAAVYVAQGTERPAWFTVGVGRAVAAKAEPRSPLVREWDAQVQHLKLSERQVDAALSAAALDADGAALAYALGKFLLTNAPRFAALRTALAGGEELAPALVKSYGGDAKTLAEQWAKRRAAGKG